jgi:MTH538 TIR-like domain (DUF1863)
MDIPRYMSSNSSTKHRVFLSYYHYDDNYYRRKFEELFGHLFISSCVNPGDINTDNSDEYIKRLIREDYISGSSVVIVLVGRQTYCRKHVDWEIYAGLDAQSKGNSGLLGILLPDYPGYEDNEYYPETTPERLVRNVDSTYAAIYRWTENGNSIRRWINQAFEAKISKADRIDNGLLQFTRNKCGI